MMVASFFALLSAVFAYLYWKKRKQSDRAQIGQKASSIYAKILECEKHELESQLQEKTALLDLSARRERCLVVFERDAMKSLHSLEKALHECKN